MALCESQLESTALLQLKEEQPETVAELSPPEKKPVIVGANVFSAGCTTPLGLAVDYRSPRSHFLPPEIEYSTRRTLTPSHASTGSSTSINTLDSSTSSGAPAKRKRGRPRVDKTSVEYIARAAARKQAREMVAMMNSSGEVVEKRKRGRPRIDKTSPEYVARKRARELEAMEKKAKRQYKRRTTGAKLAPGKAGKVSRPKRVAKGQPRKVRVAKTAQNRTKAVTKDRKVMIRRKFVRRVLKKDSGASSSTGETRVKRKYTRRAPAAGAPGASAAAPGPAGASGGTPGDSTPKKRGRKKKVAVGADGQPVQPSGGDKPRGKRGRRRKSELAAAGAAGAAGAAAGPAGAADPARKRGRPRFDSERALIINSEPIPVDSDDEPNLGSPGAASDSLSLDENLRALRHLHEKYANLGRDDEYSAHLLAARFHNQHVDVDLTGDQTPAGGATARGAGAEAPPAHVEKLEDSSDSDSSSSGSGSSSSGSSSSGSSSSSDSSSDDEGGGGGENGRSLEAHERLSSSPSPANDSRQSWHSGGAGGAGAGDAGSDSGSERERTAECPEDPHASLSESDNESPDKSFQCTQCWKWFSTNVTLKIHKRKHLRRGSNSNSRWRRRTAGTHECDCCPESFSCRETLLSHKAEAHRGAMTVRCEVCRRCFEDERELAAHDRTHTADERASRCGECGAQFQRWEQLRRHRACVHAPPAPAPSSRARHPHACHQCGKAFGHAHSLTRHLANHSKAVYRCVVCKASFARADQLAQHLNSHLATYRRLKQ